MQVMFDHALAFLVGAAILFTLAGLALRGQNAAVDSTQYYNASTNSLALMELLEQDFANIGAGMLDPENAIEYLDGESFQFQAQIDPNVPGAQRVLYTWEQVGTVSLKDGEQETYRVTRSVGNGGNVTASSFDTVTEFQITLLDENLFEVTTSALFPSVVRIDVSVAAVSQLGVSQTIEETRWVRSFRPLNLVRINGGVLNL